MASNQNNSLIASDLPKYTGLLTDFANHTSNVIKTIQALAGRVQCQELNTDKGLSLLELKNNTFLSYLINLSYTSLLKLSGLPLHNNSTVDNLVELRILLERIRPLEDKVKYQIEKYVKSGTTGLVNEKTMNLKSSIDVMDDGSSSDEDETSGSKNQKLYKAPKITQTHYLEDEKMEDKKQVRERRRALNSTMLRDVLSEYTDDPEVVHNNTILKSKAVEKLKEIERYEEKNFTRITLSKKDKASLMQLSTPGNLASEILSFRSMDALEGRAVSSKGGNKRKKSLGGKNKKGFKKRKKMH